MNNEADLLQRRKFIEQRIAERIDTLTQDEIQSLIVEFTEMVDAWCKKKKLPENIGGHTRGKVMMQASQHNRQFVDELKLHIMGDVVAKLYKGFEEKKAPAKKGANANDTATA